MTAAAFDREAYTAMLDRHAAAGGDLCHDDNDDNCCDDCGVSLGRDCGSCDGNGYHRAGCPESEEVLAAQVEAVSRVAALPWSTRNDRFGGRTMTVVSPPTEDGTYPIPPHVGIDGVDLRLPDGTGIWSVGHHAVSGRREAAVDGRFVEDKALEAAGWRCVWLR